MATGDLPSVSILEACEGTTEGLSIEARSGDASAFSDELSLIPLSLQNGEDVQQSSVIPSVPSACQLSENCEVDTEMKEASAHIEGAQSPDVVNENLKADTEVGKIVGDRNDLRPVLHHLASTTACVSNIGVSRIFDENNRVGSQCKDFSPPVSLSSRRQKFKEGLRKGLVDCGNIDVSFEKFPYYLR